MMAHNPKMMLLYIPCKDKKEAERISRHLLEKRLIACTNIHQIESIYWWEGRIEETNEYVVIAKTKEENCKKAEEEVKKLHSYNTPCILKIKADANEEYRKWVESVVL